MKLRRCLLWFALITSLLVVLMPGAASAALPQGASTPRSVPASRASETVGVVTIRNERGIDQVSAWSVLRRIRALEEAGFDALVIELDTPGGEGGAMSDIQAAIGDSGIPVRVAWIRDDAYSAGALIAIACQDIVVSPNAAMGAASPISQMPILGAPMSIPDDLKRKFLAPVVATSVNNARENDFDEYIAQAMIIPGAELWVVRDEATGAHYAIGERQYRELFDGDDSMFTSSGEPIRGIAKAGSVSDAVSGTPTPGRAEAPTQVEGEAGEFAPIESGIAQDIAGDVAQFIDRPGTRPDFTEAARTDRFVLIDYLTDGSAPLVMQGDLLVKYGLATATIRDDEELKAFFGASQLVRLNESWSEDFVRFMQQPLVRGLLIVMLLVGIFLELVKPGALIGGTLALIGLVGLIVPPMLIGMAGWWEVAAIGSGIVLLLIEVLLLPGFGLFGALGALGIIAGLFGLLMPNDAGLRELSGQGSGATAAVLIMVVSLAVTVGIIYFILRNFATLPIFSRFVLQSEPSGIGGVREQASTEHAEASPAVPVGATGRARTSLRPFGFIDIRDADGVRQTIEARSRAGYTDAGEGVRVVSHDGRVPVVDQITGGDTKATLPDEHQPPAPSQDGPPGEAAGPQQDPPPESGPAGDAPGEPGTNDPEPGAPKRDA